VRPSGNSAASAPFRPVVQWAIWAALTGSVVFYFAILRLGIVEASPEPAEGLLLPLTVAGAVLAALGLGLRQLVRNVKDTAGRRTVPAWIFPAFIVALALGEAPAIFGFVLGLTGHAENETLLLFGISLGAMLANNPASFFPSEEGFG